MNIGKYTIHASYGQFSICIFSAFFVEAIFMHGVLYQAIIVRSIEVSMSAHDRS